MDTDVAVGALALAPDGRTMAFTIGGRLRFWNFADGGGAGPTRNLPASINSVTFAPDGAYGQINGNNVFTHGVEIGVARNETHDLDTATSELIDSLAQGNRRSMNLMRSSGHRRSDSRRNRP